MFSTNRLFLTDNMKLTGLHTNNSKLIDYILLIIIILAGVLLRFWDFNGIPFTHDELSALGRLRFNSFTELINKGIIVDGHPAGVQVFLYYYTKLFGTSEIVVKLPFLISGVVAICIAYLIGKVWFDGTTGLFSAVYVATMQFFVMYSQIARPYVSGLLLTLLMVYAWSLFVFKKQKYIYLILFVLFASLSTYNHHFSLLFAAIVGISGLFFVKREYLLVYIIAGISIFILYIPHLHIFFRQLSYGGLGGAGGWLAVPSPNFIFSFIYWIFHLSSIALITTAIVVLYLVIRGGRNMSFNKSVKKRLTLLSWFLLPIIIGYLYSIFRSPVLQYSMLIFSTPYLFVLLFSFHGRISAKEKILLIGIVLTVNILTLIFVRDYYGVFYKQPYEQVVKTAVIDNNADDIFLIGGYIPYYDEYYFAKFGKSVPFIANEDVDDNLSVFSNTIRYIKQNRIVVQGLTGEQLQIVQSFFPYQIGYKHGFTYEIYTFSKNKSDKGKASRREVIAKATPVFEIGDWKNTKTIVAYDSTANDTVFFVDENMDYGPSVTFVLSNITKNGLGIIDVEMDMMMPDTITKCLIASAILDGDEVVSWNAINVEDYNPIVAKWTKVYFTIDIQSALKSSKDVEGLTLKINVWNISKNNILLKYVTVYKKPGNPIRYALFKDIYR